MDDDDDYDRLVFSPRRVRASVMIHLHEQPKTSFLGHGDIRNRYNPSLRGCGLVTRPDFSRLCVENAPLRSLSLSLSKHEHRHHEHITPWAGGEKLVIPF